MNTSNDQIISVKNSLTLANKLADLGIIFELHIYPDAPHEVTLENEITKRCVEKWCNTSISKWIENTIIRANSI